MKARFKKLKQVLISVVLPLLVGAYLGGWFMIVALSMLSWGLVGLIACAVLFNFVTGCIVAAYMSKYVL